MTIGPREDALGAEHDGTSATRDDEHDENLGPNPVRDEREVHRDERRTLLLLAGRILGSWSTTARFLAILVVIIGGLWLLGATVDLGLIRLGKP